LSLSKESMKVLRLTIYKQKRKVFVFLLYYHVFPHLLWHFSKWHWHAWTVAPEDTKEAQKGATASDPIGRDSRGPPHWASGSENWEVEANGGEGEMKATKVPEATLGQGSGWGCCLFGGHWSFPDHKV